MAVKKTPIKKKAPAKKVGRPSPYKEEYNEQVYKLCLLGATDKDIADFFDVVESTINKWKIDFPKFSESIKSGKKIADMHLASKLKNRAEGAVIRQQQAFKTKEVYYNDDGKRCEREIIQIVDLEQEQPPDTTALIFWLKNRKSDSWRDKQEFDHTSKGDKIATDSDKIDKLAEMINNLSPRKEQG